MLHKGASSFPDLQVRRQAVLYTYCGVDNDHSVLEVNGSHCLFEHLTPGLSMFWEITELLGDGASVEEVTQGRAGLKGHSPALLAVPGQPRCEGSAALLLALLTALAISTEVNPLQL